MIMMRDNEYATKWKQAMPMPSGLMGRSRGFLRSATLHTLSLLDRSLGDRFLRCLYCHNVFDDQLERFERLLLHLKHQGTFIDTETCLQMLKGEKVIDNRYYHLSFDDGFRNNFINAFPILKKHHIPCIFFVPSSLIDINWDKTKKYCLETAGYKGVIETLKWEDLLEMVSSGYEIGSHTRTHSRLTTISNDPKLLEDAVLGSKKELEAHLGVECRYISWPYGRLTDKDTISLEIIKRAGYRASFGAFRGLVIPQVTNIFSIPRHHFEVHWPLSHVEYFSRGNMETGCLC